VIAEQFVASWRTGFRYDIPARVVAERVLKLSARHPQGICTAEALVASAASDRDALHAAFEWDDTVAASKYRVDQARHIMRALVILHPDEEADDRYQPLVVHVRTRENEGGYMPAADVMSDEQYRAAALGECKRMLSGVLKRYRFLHPILREVEDAINRLL
jgi:hypothetical protein